MPLIYWAEKPFSIGLLSTVFIGGLFQPLLPKNQMDSNFGGLILPAAARRTAVVFVWSNISDGEPHYRRTQVALNNVFFNVQL